MKRNAVAVGFAAVLVGALGCAVWRVWQKPPSVPVDGLAAYSEPTRDALLVPDPAGEAPQRVEYLAQGWEPRDSAEFYTRPQGSRLVPYSWFLALEQPTADAPFADANHLARYGALAQKQTAQNPDGLPVGWVKDPRRDDERTDWLGFTCAACHTSELHFGGTAYRIDGGPGQADLDRFLHDLTAALKRTLDEPARFDRFATKVLAGEAVARSRAELRDQLESVHRARAAYDATNCPPHPYGFARLDAFGRIVNSLLVSGVGSNDPQQGRAPDAPVSYPYLWDASHHDYVQWNASARNRLGSPELNGLARNVGQVVGVFGEVRISDPNTATVFTGYKSSVRVPDLIRLEQLIRKMHSPRWPDAFPAIDELKRAAGEALFARHCQSCHHQLNRTDPERTVTATRTPVKDAGTDPLMASNFAKRTGKTGKLEGRRAYFVTGERFGKEASAEAMLTHTVVGVILGSPWSQYGNADFAELRDRRGPVTSDVDALMVYKARPLNGIWATAPYLHNGSVPNLYELLLPANRRSKTFAVGRRGFDPARVGFRTEPFAGGFTFDTSLPGNAHTGHEYGTSLTDDQRAQLLEYLKSL